MRIVERILGRIPRTSALLLTTGIAAALATPAFARKVDIGGFRLNLRCAGEGSPTIVLEAGAGDSLETWDPVFPNLRKITRVCAYDRAGLGHSEAGPEPRSSGRIADELQELLRRAAVPGPFILVGHSFGGFTVRVFASRHPDEVAGMVLVDATPEDFPAREAQTHSVADREKLRTGQGLAPQAARGELEAMEQSVADVRGATLPPTIPVIVLTATHPSDPEPFRKLWSEMQARLAASFPGAVQMTVAGSDHYIQFDRPGVIVSVIRDLVEQARGQAVSAPPGDRP